MTGKQLESFVDKLREITDGLPIEVFSDILTRAVRMDAIMQQTGQTRPVWNGPLPEQEIIGKEVVFPTEVGDRVGRVVYFGVAKTDAGFERSVFVHIPSSGSVHESPGSSVKPAGAEDLQRMRREVEMARAIDRVETGPKPEPAKRKRKHDRDPAFTQRLLDHARESGLVVEQKKTFHKITGLQKGRAIYVAVEALRVDLSGFSFEHPAVRCISEQEARDAHLGAVRGTLLFTDKDAAEDAFISAMENLL